MSPHFLGSVLALLRTALVLWRSCSLAGWLARCVALVSSCQLCLSVVAWSLSVCVPHSLPLQASMLVAEFQAEGKGDVLSFKG